MKTFLRYFTLILLTTLFLQLSYAASTFTLNPLYTFGPNSDGSIKPGQSIGISPITGNDVQISAPATTFNSNTVYYGVQPGDPTGQNTTNAVTNIVASTTNITITITNYPNATNGFNMRGLAYDPITSNLIFVDTHAGSGGNGSVSQTNLVITASSTNVTSTNFSIIFSNAAIYVLNQSGTIVGALNTSTIIPNGGIGSFVVAGAADDGVVYIANQNNKAGGSLRIYRYATANPSDPAFNSPPTLAYNTNSPNFERLALTMAVRGSGPNTQILIGSADPGKVGTSAGPGTNVFLFTTGDGTNFVHHRMFIPGSAATIYNDGIAFGPTNTFFVKEVGAPLYYLAYDPSISSTAASTNNLTVISSFSGVSPNDPLLNISAIAFDTTNNLLAGMEEIGGVATGGNGKLWLYHIANPTNQAPAILATRVYTVNFQKTTAPMGYLCFGGGKLFAHASNNGFLCSTVDSVTLNPPSFTWTDFGLDGTPFTRNGDLPATTRISAGQTAHFEVYATPDVTNYQWFTNNIAVTGATSYTLDVTNVTTNMSGIVYRVTAFNAAGFTSSTASTLTVLKPSDFLHPLSLWSFKGGDTNYITSTGGGGTPNERCIAYNALSNQLLVVRGPNTFTSLRIFVVDAQTGAFQYLLKTNGLSFVTGQALTLCGIGVADDGAVYAAGVNGTGSGDQSFKVYRWADTGSNTVPTVIFGTNSSAASGNPVADFNGGQNYRYGDSLAVRGAGNDTEILVDAQNNTKYAGILRPVADGTMTNWTQTGYLLANMVGSYGSQAYGSSIGRSLQFGPVMDTAFGPYPTFWQKRYLASGTPLAAMGYSQGGRVAPLALANVSSPLYTNGPLAINFSLGLAAAVNFVAAPANDSTTANDTLDLYDVTDLSQAALLRRDTLPGSATGGFHKGNGNFVAQVVFGLNPTTGSNYIFVINGNNGISGYALSGGAVPAPKLLSQPRNQRVLQGNTATLSLLLDQGATVSWYKGTNSPVDTGGRGTILTLTNAQASTAGDYFAIATNANGSVTSSVARVSVAFAADNYSIAQVWSANPSNSAAFPYVTTNGGGNTPNERSFAYNALSNQLIVVKCPPASTAYTVYVVDANTGSNVYNLNTTGIIHTGDSEVPGSNPIDLVAAAASDDGSIYIANETPNASGGNNGETSKMLHIYRWANTSPGTTPVQIFQGDPSGQSAGVHVRWGDVIAARGGGLSTELILNSHDGAYAAVLRPSDGTLSTFTNFWFNDSSGSGSIGRSIQFGTNNTVFEKRKGGSLFLSAYNTNAPTSSVVMSVDSSGTLGGVAVDLSKKLAAGVDFVGASTSPAKPDAVSAYDISDPATPMLLNRVNFPNNQVANANFICQTIIAGNRIYALDANNGLMAFNIIPPVNSLTLTITPAGSNVNLSWGSSQAILQGSPSLTSPTWTDLTSLGATNSVQPATGTNTFYRLRL